MRGDLVRRVEVLKHMNWIIEPYIHMGKPGELTQRPLDAPCGHVGAAPLWRQFQLDNVQYSVRIPREHAGAGRTVHTAFPALCSLAVVVAIDHRTAGLLGN